jgi:hypothetical protein
MEELFERATRQRLRFETARGELAVEDLWDLPLSSTNGKQVNLDAIAVALHLRLRSGADVSFVNKEKKSDERTQLMFDVVKHIIDVRLDEVAAAEKEKERAEKRQRILGILADKDDEELRGMSKDDLRRLLEESV